jgi:hypothetical protein
MRKGITDRNGVSPIPRQPPQDWNYLKSARMLIGFKSPPPTRNFCC